MVGVYVVCLSWYVFDSEHVVSGNNAHEVIVVRVAMLSQWLCYQSDCVIRPCYQSGRVIRVTVIRVTVTGNKAPF